MKAESEGGSVAPSRCLTGEQRRRSFQHSGKRPDRTDPIYRDGLGAGAGRTKPANKRHIMSHPHSKTGYALENQTVFELTGMRRKPPYFLPTSSPLNPPILETARRAVQVIHDPDQGAI